MSAHVNQTWDDFSQSQRQLIRYSPGTKSDGSATCSTTEKSQAIGLAPSIPLGMANSRPFDTVCPCLAAGIGFRVQIPSGVRRTGMFTSRPSVIGRKGAQGLFVWPL